MRTQKTNYLLMKKSLQTLALSLILGSSALLAQTHDIVMPCATYEAMEQAFLNSPDRRLSYEQEQEKLRIATEEYEKSLQTHKVGAAFQYTIPVVFHILHTYGPENIADANCIAALANINNDFAKTGPDVAGIHATFAPLYINSDIKFMLAHKDPSGNCTSGIVHHYNVNTDWNQSAPDYAYSGTTAGKWNPTKYLNIYVVRSICPTTSTCSSAGGITIGYTYKPGTWATGAAADVFVIRAGWVSSNYIDSRTLSHEIGHWLNLSHTWGNTNQPGVSCGNDGVTDTPVTKGYFSTCPVNGPYSGCSNPENVENIMDYSSCPKMFTTGQTNVMRATLASSTSGRNNLWTTANLTATDVDGAGNCAPIADFYSLYGTTANVYTVCQNGSLTFVDASYNASVTGRSWSATGGGVVASPTNNATNVTFPTPGTQTVTLIVSSATGTASTTRTVIVSGAIANYNSTYQESFEGTGLPANWTVINQTGGTTWQQNTGSAATGTKSYFIQNAINPNGAIDILETPSYDFAANPGATFTFKYAYAQQTAAWADQFVVQATSNCGGSWTNLYSPSSSVMASGSGGVTSTPFYPTSSQFKMYTITTNPLFNPFKTQSNVRFRFYFREDPASGFGNNIFLDDINFNGTLGVNELTQSIGFVVYPNPTSGAATMEFTLSDNADISYNVVDVIGRVVEEQKPFNAGAGNHSITINPSQKLISGIYFVNFEMNGQKMSRKLIIE
jgi:hypothetical protein